MMMLTDAAAVTGNDRVIAFDVVPAAVAVMPNDQMMSRPNLAYRDHDTVLATAADCVNVGVNDVHAPPSPIRYVLMSASVNAAPVHEVF
jgi:hypothetical protein